MMSALFVSPDTGELEDGALGTVPVVASGLVLTSSVLSCAIFGRDWPRLLRSFSLSSAARASSPIVGGPDMVSASTRISDCGKVSGSVLGSKQGKHASIMLML